ncbi:unnamed protein product [Rodentolepis nana]|uniref:Uncharacterized protein n=1 Tax=Rodentolepis nana TaxID=102285 RepID=A0A0R3T6B6_RODNA|nr:unnamed protein product [Rodentolepis nana]
MLSSDYKECEAYMNKFCDFDTELNKSIDGFVNQFQTATIGTCNRGFDFNDSSTESIRNFMISDFEKLKKNLEKIQNLVISNLNGNNQIRNNSDEPEQPVGNEVDELEHIGDSAKELISRFNHKCDRCSSRNPLRASSPKCLLQDRLDLPTLSDTEQEVNFESEPKYNEEDAGRRLQLLCKSNSVDLQTAPDSSSPLSFPVSNETSVTFRSLDPSQSMAVFKRSSSLTRLAPLKLRPILRQGTKLSRSKNLGNRAVDEGKPPLTSFTGKTATKIVSNSNSSAAIIFTQNDSRKSPSLQPLKPLKMSIVDKSDKKPL